MKNKSRRALKDSRRDAREKKLTPGNPLKISFGIIILVYILVPNFTPNWMTLDTNAPKFMALAVVNLLSFLILLFDSDMKRKPGIMSGFFRTWPGLALTGLLLMTLLSFSRAINPIESVMELSKYTSLFAATFMLSAILTYDLRYIRMIAFVLAGILIFDSVSVFYYINEFIQRNINEISDIKTVYSNKNILASAIYVKIPAALWLMLFEKSWLKRMGIVALFFGFLSTFFMATRTFYLGLIVATIFFLLYSGYNYYREREKRHIHLLAIYLGALVLALGTFTVIQKNFYPKSGNRHTQGVGQQLNTIVTGDSSTSIRLSAWGWSGEMIKNSPLLGVGAGNWKVAVLEYENQTKPNFIYSYKAHNDFLETTAERGIFGGLLYIAIFATVFWAFLRLFFKQSTQESVYKSLFFAATGVFFYSMDAFFNFPGDRPEILALFGLYLGIGIASINLNKQATHQNHDAPAMPEAVTKVPFRVNSGIKKVAVVLGIAALAAVPYVFYLNFESSKLQRVVYQEIMSGTLKEPADRFVEGFTKIPNISHWGESVSTLKARYLIQEKRHEEALAAIRDDILNPYDSRREYFMAICFNELNMPDSALFYSQKAHAVKPFYFRNLQLMLNLLEQKGEQEEVINHLEYYISSDKRNNNAWIMLTNALNRAGELDAAYEHIQEAIKYLPRDSLINRQNNFLQFRKFVEPHRHLYNTAMGYYQSGNFARSVPYFTQYIDSIPPDAAVYRMRAMAYYQLRQFQNAISDINQIVELGVDDSSLINLRGACYQGLGNRDAACQDFEAAMNDGNASGIENYERFCR